MKIISKRHIDRIPAGTPGEVLHFGESEPGLVYFTCIFYGYPGTYVVEHRALEPLN